jgi:hypothetical protein
MTKNQYRAQGIPAAPVSRDEAEIGTSRVTEDGFLLDDQNHYVITDNDNEV